MIFWYKARLYINDRFFQTVLFKSDYPDYFTANGNTNKIIKCFNGFVVTLEIIGEPGRDTPQDAIEKLNTAHCFPFIFTEV